MRVFLNIYFNNCLALLENIRSSFLFDWPSGGSVVFRAYSLRANMRVYYTLDAPISYAPTKGIIAGVAFNWAVVRYPANRDNFMT